MAPIALAFAVLDLTGSKSDLGFVLAVRQGAVIVEDVRTLERRDVVSAADAEGAATV
jgi:hypothetical protein